MMQLDHTPGRTARLGGKEYLFFSGYSYLGMQQVPEFVALVEEGLDKYGWLFPSSRVSNTQLALFDELEETLSSLTGMEATVCFSSGFLAGRAARETLPVQGNLHCAPHSHPAICDPTNNSGDFQSWSNRIAGEARETDGVLFDSVNPLAAEVNDPGFLHHLPAGVSCLVDDSHGTGLIHNGKGVGPLLPSRGNCMISYSLSKAWNIQGGAVGCSRQLAARLRANPHYTASTSISPAFAWAFPRAQGLYDLQRERLRRNIALFRERTGDRYRSHPELPIFILPAPVSEAMLEEARIIISSFAYPDPAGQPVQRVVLNALHEAEDLERLAEVLQRSHQLG